MNLDSPWFTSPRRQLLWIGALTLIGVGVIAAQHRRKGAPPLPTAAPAVPPALPKSFTREVTKFPPPPVPVEPPRLSASHPAVEGPAAVREKPDAAPLTLLATPLPAAPAPAVRFAPFGRLIPCATVVTLESSRLDTPVIGLVTADVWHAGQLVVPAGAEVHGRVTLDRTRERLAAQGEWRIVWRTPGTENGTELAVAGLALDRDYDSVTGQWGEQDGSAGLRGAVLRTNDDHALHLFAATFLSGAAAVLQTTRPTTGLLGEFAVPVATARNAALSGTSAVLHDYARSLREALARDGVYVRVPAGKPFYLYVTEPLDHRRARRAPPTPPAP